MTDKNVFISPRPETLLGRRLRRTIAEGRLRSSDKRALAGLEGYRILIASGAGQGVSEAAVRDLVNRASGLSAVVEHRRDRVVLVMGLGVPADLAAVAEDHGLFLSVSPGHRNPRLIPLAFAQAYQAGLRRFFGPGRLFPLVREELTPSDQDEMEAYVLRLQALMRGGSLADLEAFARSGLVVLARQPRAARKLAFLFGALRARFLEPFPELIEVDPFLRRRKGLLVRPESVGSLGEFATALSEFLHRLGTQSVPSEGSSLMEQAMEFTRTSLDPGLTMAVVANHFSMNYSRFSQRFKEATGMGFNDYLRKVKVDKSIELLKDSPLRVYEVARRAGYQSTKHFMKVFKEQTGLSPTEFRLGALG